MAEAASAAIAAGEALSVLADAERTGVLRARRALSTEVLRHVARAAKRTREADSEYEQAVARAGRIGLSHREIATAAQVAHATVRAILTRARGQTEPPVAEPDTPRPPSHSTDSPPPS